MYTCYVRVGFDETDQNYIWMRIENLIIRNKLGSSIAVRNIPANVKLEIEVLLMEDEPPLRVKLIIFRRNRSFIELAQSSIHGAHYESWPWMVHTQHSIVLVQPSVLVQSNVEEVCCQFLPKLFHGNFARIKRS